MFGGELKLNTDNPEFIPFLSKCALWPMHFMVVNGKSLHPIAHVRNLVVFLIPSSYLSFTSRVLEDVINPTLKICIRTTHIAIFTANTNSVLVSELISMPIHPSHIVGLWSCPYFLISQCLGFFTSQTELTS